MAAYGTGTNPRTVLAAKVAILEAEARVVVKVIVVTAAVTAEVLKAVGPRVEVMMVVAGKVMAAKELAGQLVGLVAMVTVMTVVALVAMVVVAKVALRAAVVTGGAVMTEVEAQSTRRIPRKNHNSTLWSTLLDARCTTRRIPVAMVEVKAVVAEQGDLAVAVAVVAPVEVATSQVEVATAAEAVALEVAWRACTRCTWCTAKRYSGCCRGSCIATCNFRSRR